MDIMTIQSKIGGLVRLFVGTETTERNPLVRITTSDGLESANLWPARQIVLATFDDPALLRHQVAELLASGQFPSLHHTITTTREGESAVCIEGFRQFNANHVPSRVRGLVQTLYVCGVVNERSFHSGNARLIDAIMLGARKKTKDDIALDCR